MILLACEADSPIPTATLIPTTTSVPTVTPMPTATPAPTATPMPQPTPLPVFTPDLLQPNATTISAGEFHTCALMPDRTPHCWGSNEFGEAPVKLKATANFSAITSGQSHNCGLRSDGSWMCWGYYDSGIYHFGHVPFHFPPRAPPLVKVPTPKLSERFSAMSSGTTYACALRLSGEAVCWGVDYEAAAWPFRDERFKAISSSEFHTCALRVVDTPVCWSNDDWTVDLSAATISDMGSCTLNPDQSIVCTPTYEYVWKSYTDTGGYVHCPPPDRPQGEVCAGMRSTEPDSVRISKARPPDGLRLAVISSGRLHTCGLRLDGTPVCWADVDTYTGEPRPIVQETPGNERFGALSSGGLHTCALRLDGSPVCWGINWDGRASPPDGERFVAISSGRYHTCALRVDGSPVCWGSDDDGQSSPPDVRFAIALGEGS